MAKKDSAVTVLPVDEITPAAGGSYIRNPETGELELQNRTAETAANNASDEIPFSE